MFERTKRIHVFTRGYDGYTLLLYVKLIFLHANVDKGAVKVPV